MTGRRPAMRPGRRIRDWILVDRLGRGAFGQVWRARHELSGQLVAIKIPHGRGVTGALDREDSLIGRLRHPLIVEMLAADLEARPPWVAYRYVDGQSAREMIRLGQLPVEAALGIYGDVLAALDHAHREGVIHGDVRPENVIVDRDGRGHLTDFGLGRVVGEVAGAVARAGRRRTDEGVSISGNLEYLAPEQRRGVGDARSDLYALALVFFEMLTGALPEGAESPSDLRAGLDPRIDALFHRGHARPERRYGSAREAIDDLDRVLEARRTGERTCTECGTTVGGGDYYCAWCGSRLRADLDRCECGFLPEAGDRYCIRCGKERHAGGLVR